MAKLKELELINNALRHGCGISRNEEDKLRVMVKEIVHVLGN